MYFCFVSDTMFAHTMARRPRSHRKNAQSDSPGKGKHRFDMAMKLVYSHLVAQQGEHWGKVGCLRLHCLTGLLIWSHNTHKETLFWTTVFTRTYKSNEVNKWQV